MYENIAPSAYRVRLPQSLELEVRELQANGELHDDIIIGHHDEGWIMVDCSHASDVARLSRL